MLLEQQRLAQVQAEREESSKGRLRNAHGLEREITKLGEVFSQFTTLVAQQAELTERIETDIEGALGEVEAGHNEITKAYSIVKGNRGLIVKIFVMLFIFIALFLYI